MTSECSPIWSSCHFQLQARFLFALYPYWRYRTFVTVTVYCWPDLWLCRRRKVGNETFTGGVWLARRRSTALRHRTASCAASRQHKLVLSIRKRCSFPATANREDEARQVAVVYYPLRPAAHPTDSGFCRRRLLGISRLSTIMSHASSRNVRVLLKRYGDRDE